MSTSTNYADWSRRVSERFPLLEPQEAMQRWEYLKSRLQLGQTVTGQVIAKAPFGAWVDLGFGFPALLQIIHIAGLTPELYRADDWCPLGSEVTATVRWFNDKNQQICLRQVDGNDGKTQSEK
jgi:ribosomal protein S1